MFAVGQIVRHKDSESTEVFTVCAVSAFVEMIKIDGGWGWAEGFELVEADPDSLDEQLKFLGVED